MKSKTSLRIVLASIAVAVTAVAVAVPLSFAGYQEAEDTVTGCLNVTNGGAFQLTIVEDGKREGTITVQGTQEQLGAHAKNHTVKLTGTMAEESGKQVFKVTKVEHVSGTCEAPTE